MGLEVDLLGRFTVRRDGQQLAGAGFGGQLAQRLVRLLALRRGEVVTRDALVEALWEKQPPADPEANLNVVVNRARRGLGDPGAVETVPGGYSFSMATDITVDVERFEALVRTAREQTDRGQPRTAKDAALSALAMWHGEPLPEDAYADWAQPYRERLERTCQEALELAAAAALETGDQQHAADLAAEAVSRQPLREAAHLLRIRALAVSGDVAGALAAYDVLRHRLADELGIDPSREASELQLRLLRGQPSFEPPPGPTAAAGAESTTAPPFVGREQELARLGALGRGQRVGLVPGRSGSGKSRLLAEIAARSDREVLAARAVQPEREAPWSLARNLLRSAIRAGADPENVLPTRSRAAMTDLLPELSGDGPPATLDAQSRRALSLEGGARLVATVGRALAVVDDLQWADASSLDLLTVVASRTDELTMVLAYRPEEIPPDQEIMAFLTELAAKEGTLEVPLGPLDQVAVERLVPDRQLASVLTRETDGTPFAILEVIRTLDQQQVLRRDGSVWRPAAGQVRKGARAAAVAGQRRSVVVRAGRQPAKCRELLDLLALLDRPAPAALLAEATGATVAAVGVHLDRLARAELIRHDGLGWAVAHDLVGEALRDRLGPFDRARLHQQLARALDTDTETAGERAHHLAGAGDRRAAAAAYATAAHQQLERFADREAERLAHAGLALGPTGTTRAELLEVRGETRFRTGDLPGARDDLRAALALTEAAPDRSRLLARLASFASGAEDLLLASNLVDLALAEARDDAGSRARALAVGAIVDMNLDRPQRAEARYAEALTLFERVGDARGIADVLDAQAMATFLDGDITAAVTAFDQVARLFTDAGNLLRVVTPRSTRGHGLVFAGSPDNGLVDADEALELARSLGSPEGQAYALWHRSEALTGCEQADQAVTAATEALAIAEHIGHRGWTATALLALGIAHHALGDLDAAEDDLRRSLATSENLPLFASWAHAKLGQVLVALDRLDEADQHIQQALTVGPPLGHYEARLARCQLAAARRETDARKLIVEAADWAARGGHHASLKLLLSLRDTAGR